MSVFILNIKIKRAFALLLYATVFVLAGAPGTSEVYHLTMYRPSQTTHLNLSSERIAPATREQARLAG
ncbi:hypothetical protein JTE90_025227 [Oedothorax gibbosus]|uniref:Uncharacterized protein n=1 Tax=Oedothorax gibbosus TaxID=931172 RepID=A0AAV6TKH5_9ARAC|nr:hypothetical protein JTE90_025227 [Oedothorax gibbosus]